ncbi:MAG TPA: cupin domain-containing protein [Candidatus Methylomirabilis sp.]|nr:cupin domain-containing protein [Candidatus Methylomirabilis sp.]
MPIYHIAELTSTRPDVNPAMIIQSVTGEFMKAGIVTKPEGEGPPLHMHPTEEQFTLVLEGKLHMILGDEDRIVEHGDLVHIPRFTPHRSRAVGGPAVFFTVKYPAGSGDLNRDYHEVAGAEEAEAKYPGKAKTR